MSDVIDGGKSCNTKAPSELRIFLFGISSLLAKAGMDYLERLLLQQQNSPENSKNQDVTPQPSDEKKLGNGGSRLTKLSKSRRS